MICSKYLTALKIIRLTAAEERCNNLKAEVEDLEKQVNQNRKNNDGKTRGYYGTFRKKQKGRYTNGFGTASSFQNQPENANWGNFGNDYGNTNGNPFGNNFGNGADTLVVHHLAELEVLGGIDGFGTVNLI